MIKESPADRHKVGLAPFGYVTGMRSIYHAFPRTAFAFVDWCIRYGLQRPFRVEFPEGGGLWFGKSVSVVTTSAPEEFSSVCGNWPLEPYPLSYGPGRRIIELELQRIGLRIHPMVTEYAVPLSLTHELCKFVAVCFENGNAVAGYASNGVWWIRVSPAIRF